MRFLRRLFLFIFALILIGICSRSFGQQVFPIGNPTAINRALGEYAADSALKAPKVKKVFPNFDSTGNIAVVGGILYYHDGNHWAAVDTGAGTGVTLVQLNDSLANYLKLKDSTTKWVTITQLNDSFGTHHSADSTVFSTIYRNDTGNKAIRAIVIDLIQSYGIAITGAAGQTVGSSPGWVISTDTTKIPPFTDTLPGNRKLVTPTYLAAQGYGTGTVTSVTANPLSPLFTTSVATATTTPAISFTLNTQSANLVFAGPSSGGAAAPTFRSLVSPDIPSLTGGQVGISGLSATGTPSSTTFLRGDNTWSAAGTGTVTSVGLSTPSIFSVTPTPITTAGTFSVTAVPETANTFWGAPNGSTGQPTFRTLVSADLPGGTGTVTSIATTSPLTGGTITTTGTLGITQASTINSGYLSSVDWNTFNGKLSSAVTSVGLSTPSIFSVSPTSITSTGVFTVTAVSETANTVWAAPNGSSGQPTFRALVAADLPAGTGTVTSVSNSDGTLTVTPTTGAVVASINLTNANTWGGLQTFHGIKLTDGSNIDCGSTTGTIIATDPTHKLGFYNTTPVVQQTGDIRTGLSNLGLITLGTLSASSITGTLGTGNGGTGATTQTSVNTISITYGANNTITAAPSGSAGGDLTGTYPNPTLAAAGTAGTYGSATQTPVFTTDSKGRVTAVTNTTITPAYANVTGTPVISLTVNGVTGNNNTAITVNPIPTGVSAGTCTYCTITHNIYGEATAYSNGTNPVTSIVAGTNVTTSGTTVVTVNVPSIPYSSVTGTPVISATVNGVTVNNNTAVTVNATPSGNAGGSLTGTYPNPTIAASGVTAAAYGGANSIPIVTVGTDGRVTSVTTVNPYSTGGTVTSVGLTTPSIFSVTPTPITTSGTFSVTAVPESANTFWAAPNGSSGQPTFRTIGTADVPTLNQSTTGSAGSLSPGANINGVSFTGSSNITVTAAANTLTTATLNPTVVTSSLTSVGTITSGIWNGTTIAQSSGGTGATTQTSVNTTPITYGANNTITAVPSGNAGGDLTGTYPNPTLAATGTSGTYGGSNAIPIVTTDSKGRITSITTVNPVSAPVSSVSNSDGTLTISPTTGSVVGSLNLANADTWTALQTFNKGIVFPSLNVTPATPTTGNTVFTNSVNVLTSLNNNGFQTGLDFTGNTANRIYTGANHNFTFDNLSTSTTTTNGYFKGSGGLGTFVTSIPNGDLANSSITINGTSTSLGGSVLTGTVNAVSIASANGFGGTSSGGATPALTITTSINGLMEGNGTAAVIATSTNVLSALGTQPNHTFLGNNTGSAASVGFYQPAYTDISGTPTIQTTINGTIVANATPVTVNPIPAGTAGTYGSATQTPVFTTNSYGEVTGVTNTTITPAYANVTGTPVIQTTINGTVVANGVPVTVNPVPTAVTPGTYTNTNLTVNAAGQITAASNGAAGGVTSVIAGTNVSVTGTSTPTVSVTNYPYSGLSGAPVIQVTINGTTVANGTEIGRAHV